LFQNSIEKVFSPLLKIFRSKPFPRGFLSKLPKGFRTSTFLCLFGRLERNLKPFDHFFSQSSKLFLKNVLFSFFLNFTIVFAKNQACEEKRFFLAQLKFPTLASFLMSEGLAG
jgi:hypothetical protein